jgi:hypothetical protein
MSGKVRASEQTNEAAIALVAQTDSLRTADRAGSFETEGRGIAEWIAHEAAAAWAACGAFEWVALGYLVLSSALIVLFAENLAHPVQLVGAQVFVAAPVLAGMGRR